MRLLDAKGIKYKEHTYDPSIVDGVSVAKEVGEDPECVFKTLVCQNETKEHFVFVVPVASSLNLKKAAKASGNKSIVLIHQAELLPLTGYVHGGCSPIGLKKPFPVYIDETAILFDTIFVSGGKKGYQIEIDPNDLSSYCSASFVSLCD